MTQGHLAGLASAQPSLFGTRQRSHALAPAHRGLGRGARACAKMLVGLLGLWLLTLPAWAGITSSSDPHGFPGCSVSCSDAAGSSGTGPAGAPPVSEGMPTYGISPMLISLTVRDTPLSWTPPVGPAMDFTLGYNQRDTDQPATISFGHVGPQWSHNWLSYVQDNPATPGSATLVYLPLGTGRPVQGYNASTGAFAPEVETGAQLVRVSLSPVVYERRFPDGGKDVYATSDGSTATPRRVFLSQRVDAHGNTVRLAYDTQARLITVTDPLGHALHLQYTVSGQPLLVSRVSDDFGRSTTLAYDSAGRLAGITDALGLTSRLAYDSGANLTALTTPYGTTRFETGQQGQRRWINVTDANGHVSRMEFNQSVPGVPYSESQVPSGIKAFNQYLNSRDSFFWDAYAYEQAADDYSKAVIYHWAHLTNGNSLSSVTADTLESLKYPLENRLWFNYPNDLAGGSGTLNVPTAIARVLPDGSTQLTRQSYNAYGNLTQRLDAAGLTTTLTYADNGIDVRGIAYSGTGYSATEAFTYNSQHLPLTYTDALGGVTRYTYNTTGQVLTETDPLNHVRRWTYDRQGYLVTETDANGHATAYTYDAAGRVATRKDAAGQVTRYAYDALNRLTRTTYPDGTYAEDTYDKLDRVAHRDRRGLVTTYAYDAMRNLVRETDPRGHATTYTYYPNNLLRSRTDANGGTTQWLRDLEGRVVQRLGPQGGATTFTYDTANRLLTQANALGHAVSYLAYDGADRPTRVKDANGVLRDLQYHPRGWLTGLTVRASSDGTASTDDATWAFAYDATGQLLNATDPDGVATTQAFDAAHRLTALTDAQRNRRAFTLDAVGNRTAETLYADSHGSALRVAQRTWRYDALDRPDQQRDGLGQLTQYAYDSDSRPVSRTNPLAVVTRTRYDAEGHVTATVEDERGLNLFTARRTTSYDYDAAGHLVKVTDPEGLVTRYTRDALGQLTWQDSPDTGLSGRTYDVAGRIARAVDARGVTVSYAYDPLDRRTAVTYADASQDVAYAYDEPNSATGCPRSAPVGRLTRLVEGNGTRTVYCYDSRGNVSRKVQTLPNGRVDTTQYDYTRADRLASILYPSGHRVRYERDANGRVAGVRWQAAGSAASTPVVSAMQYLPFGPVKQYALGPTANQVVTRSYDLDYRMNGLQSPALQLYLTYDPAGRVLAANDKGSLLPTDIYVHDALDRLVSDTVMDGLWLRGIETYAYNPTGDRLSKISLGFPHVQAAGLAFYQPGTHRLLTAGASTYRYDANGNTIERHQAGERWNLAYDSRNRLALVQRQGQDIAAYTYNALGERIGKDTLYPTLLSQRYVYDEQHHLLGEYGDTARDYVWVDDLPVAVVDTQNGIATVNYIHADGLNTPRAVTDAAKKVLWAWPYSGNPYGEQPPVSNGFALNLRFPGQYYDAETGTHYNVHRDYDPTTGRYEQSDPIGLDGGVGTYTYAANSPLIFVDPDGQICVYSQSTGSLRCTDDNTGTEYLTCGGYAGTGEGRNNPDMDNQANIGPLPRGDYTVGEPFTHPHAGPGTRRLTPAQETDMHGRSGMLMHGDNNRHDASNGCIVAPRNCRNAVPAGEILRVTR